MRHFSISGNKSSYLLEVPSRRGIILARDLPSRLQRSHAEPQPRGEIRLCIHLTGCHGDTVHLPPEFPFELALHWCRNTSDKAGRYCYKNNLLSQWCPMCKCSEYICAICMCLLCSCNGTKMDCQTLHHSLSTQGHHTVSAVTFTCRCFDRMQSGMPANSWCVWIQVSKQIQLFMLIFEVWHLELPSVILQKYFVDLQYFY